MYPLQTKLSQCSVSEVSGALEPAAQEEACRVWMVVVVGGDMVKEEFIALGTSSAPQVAKCHMERKRKVCNIRG